ncbi:plasmid pRiA4b ORF-3 family protein [Bacillus sp. V3B]|uniref:plasmid pRiA4b ORF-3 family protein n=1 Tax=Bacillus sp. V3B TaxID=2804915 RepID=UPI00210A7C95|nr:plasmid pRiA4b ORF-3 family protein [Bacillus sp. V3B]MCQ6277246.1 plasmid pRiA4b ORF-3 family protein [Bacillus sp. V3B]
MQNVTVEEEKETKSLVELLTPLFPNGELTTTLKKSPPSSIAGTYLFKVKLRSSCWRVLQVSSTHTLLDLHYLIQRAFHFDDDHLYTFYMDGKKYGENCYNAPMDNFGPYVNEAEIGDLNLYEGQGFLYLFDFGDEWEFDIQVLKIIEDEENAAPRILEEHGEDPDQYGW